MKKLILLILVFSLNSFAFTDKEKASFEKRAKSIVVERKKAFKKELMAGMKKGAHNAMESCHMKAPHLIEHDHKGYKVGRTSHKLRSEANKAPEWTVEYLEKLKGTSLFGKKKGDPPANYVVEVNEKTLGYVEALYIMPACLKCHGEKVSKKVEDQLKANYPKDQARGFKLGDFRGLFWVEHQK